MQISPFKLERYFNEREFKARYLLCASNCEPLKLRELLALADADSLKLWDELGLGYTEFCDRLYRERGVLLLPAQVYDFPCNHFRIAFGRKDMPEALKELDEFVTSQ